MQKTKIEWLHWPDGRPGYSWNPIRGLCPVGCWYCYGRRMYQRFKWDPRLAHVWTGHFSEIPSRIFVCSTMELFCPAVSVDWRNRIFGLIEVHPEHTFFILTKLPQNIDRPMPENVWLGVSVTNQEDADKRISILLESQAEARFVSIEPMLDPVMLTNSPYNANYLEGWEVRPICNEDGEPEQHQFQTERLNWVVVGRLTGHGKKHDPKLEWVKAIVREARKTSTPVFLKNNLSGTWPGKLIQEFPKCAKTTP